MKKLYFLLLVCFGFLANAQVINFTDANLKAKLLAASPSNQIARGVDVWTYIKIDVNNDGEIQLTEAALVYWLNISNQPAGNSDITNLVGLEYFTNLQRLDCSDNSITNLVLSGLNNLDTLLCSYNNMTAINLSNLPSFKNLHCQNNNLTSLNFSAFQSLEEVYCSSNSNLTSIVLSNLPSFKKLNATFCNLSNLNMTNLPLLEDLNIVYNAITNLNLSSFSNLKYLQCANNLLPSLDVSNLTNLSNLVCANNQLTQLDISNLTNLASLNCGGNQITSLDFSNLTNLTYLICAGNQLTTLDVSNCTLLTLLHCYSNTITHLIIKNGVNYALQYGSNYVGDGYKLYSNPNLSYVCVDDDKINSVQSYFNSLPNLVVNSYCSFVPGGNLYAIQGNVTYDQNQDGCGSNDISIPNLNLSILNGTNYTGYINSNASGLYSLNLNAGNYSITPVLENSNYFTISPSSYNVSFPTNSSPFNQNFCMIKNGDHNDLEVWLFPIGIARPGFDSPYKMVYKNKGTNTQSGTISFMFNDELIDLVSSNPVVSNQTTNSLNWTFSNLQPFETREILLTLNMNSPTDTPPLNSGQLLNYSTLINGAIDETPTDNTAFLNQVVVNSFDPNDKTCLEGTTITPDKVGEYVHYIIRFENTGTANAQNIVVKDIIDTTKYDMATLIPMDGSHDFFTRISNTNQVEFIFENINLPFDDANNDGYVAFKIKTNSNLTVGSSFSNTANIYFDYNSPIVTNTSTTTIEALGNSDFEFTNYFTLSPVPTKDVLHFETNQSISVSSISIYNTLGQLILVETNPSNQINVSNLKTGNYFIKVISDKGTSVGKFIKQ